MSNVVHPEGAAGASADILGAPVTEAGAARRSSFTVSSLRDQKGLKLTTTINYDPDNFLHKHVLIRKRATEHHKPTFRGKICRFLHSQVVTNSLNALLVIDLISLIISMQLELYFHQSQIEAHSKACAANAATLDSWGNNTMHHWEGYLEMVSVGILSLFLLENIGLLYGEGMEFFQKPMEIMDFFVVALSLYFELAKDTFAAGVLLLSRTWRFVRVIHGMVELEHEQKVEGDRVQLETGGEGQVQVVEGRGGRLPGR